MFHQSDSFSVLFENCWIAIGRARCDGGGGVCPACLILTGARSGETFV